ncbi:LysR family transcriptional regulator [Terasakiella sp. SH-1]|uniref:LysR family transcriptional regulator n=1 Tax=Terasakiella sp. SH-1 TaxID=2560057 RepID=UPI0010738760|nr:LysR family transcriptional regulator [Terasakiella sp. SH-1]
MQSFDIVTLRVFLGVARLGSIGAAARNEHIAASAASRRISDLEHDLDTVLIKRTPTGASLTAAGKTFATHCETLLSQYADIRADLKRFSQGEGGEFRIAAITSVMNGRLPHIVARFKEENPQLTIHLREIFSQEGIRYLREDLADLIVISDTAVTKGFDTVEFDHDPVWVIGQKGHPVFEKRAKMTPVSFADTLDYEHISFHEGGVLDELVAEASRKAGRVPSYKTKVMRFGSLRNCAQAGLGLGFIRESLARPFLKNTDLDGRPLSDEWAKRELICVVPKGQVEAPVIAKFIECMTHYQK